MHSQIIAKKRDRILASVIDNLIYLVIFVAVWYFFGKKSTDTEVLVLHDFPALIMTILTFLLWPLSEAFFGQTIGKRLVGLKVVDESFKDIRTRQAFLRFIFGALDMSCFCLGLIIASNNPKNQRIGDLIAKTIVVDLDKKESDQNSN